MSQRATLQALDAQLVTAFKDAGLADPGAYTGPAGGAAVDVDVMVDRSVQIFGDEGAGIPAPAIVVSLLLAQVTPAKGGTVVVDGDTFTLCDELERDESRSRWTVLP
jgi:hypothetical protein